MKIVLSAGNYSSALVGLKRERKKIGELLPESNIKLSGYFSAQSDSGNWNLAACQAWNKKENLELLRADFLEFSPDLVISWREEIIADLAAKNNFALWDCSGTNLKTRKFKKENPKNRIVTKFDIQANKIYPISFWPFWFPDMGKEQDCCFPIWEEQNLLNKKGYFCFQHFAELDFLPLSKNDIFISDGSTYDLLDAFYLGLPRIILFPNFQDPESIFNSYLMEEFDLGRIWDNKLDLEELPEINYERISFPEEKHLANQIANHLKT